MVESLPSSRRTFVVGRPEAPGRIPTMVTRLSLLFHLLHRLIEQAVSPRAQAAGRLHQLVEGELRHASPELEHHGIELALSRLGILLGGDPLFELGGSAGMAHPFCRCACGVTCF